MLCPRIGRGFVSIRTNSTSNMDHSTFGSASHRKKLKTSAKIRLRVLCPAPLVNGRIGFYISTDIMEHESQIKSDGGVQIWRERIGGLRYRNKILSSSTYTYGERMAH